MPSTSGKGSGPEKDSGSLHVGYTGGHLDPFHLDLDSLTRGLAVVGQSGCGKSFFLARLLEEMILNGRGQDNYLVVDTGSDFRRGLKRARKELFALRLHALTKHASSPDCARVKGKGGVLRSERAIWRNKIKTAAACQKAVVFGYNLPRTDGPVNVAEFALDWRPLLHDGRVLLRSLPTWSDERVEHTWGLSWALHNWGLAVGSEQQKTLQRFCRYFWDLATAFQLSKSGVLDAGTERGLAVDLEALRTSKEWRDSEENQPDANGLPEALLKQRVSILETETLADDAARMRVVLHSLEYLWELQLRNRDEALRSEENKPGRPAWFIFVEEAHRFAPEKPANPLTRRVSELLQKIAAEGRKYGLYLVLATQRPTKVARGLLGECDNAVIMKMNSRADLEFLANEMRILDVKLLETALHFQGKGNALAIGEAAGAAPNVVQFLMAPRRTAEGGGDLVRAPENRLSRKPKAPSQSKGKGAA